MSISSVDSGPLHVKPEIDLNLATEANRILFVLNKVIERVQFVGLLHHFTKDNGIALQKILNKQILSQIVKKCERYYKTLQRYRSGTKKFYPKTPRGSSSKSDLDDDYLDSDSKDIEAGENDEDERDSKYDEGFSAVSSGNSPMSSQIQKQRLKRKHDELAEVINLLEENPKVKKMAASMKHQLPPEMKFLVKTLLEFREQMEKRLTENATQYKTRQKYMKETYEKNERAKREIEKLEEELVVTKTDANVCLIGRNILIKRHQNKIERVKTHSLEAVEKRVNESEKEMVNNWKESSERQEQLKNDLLQASEKYSSMLKENLATEKILRSKRSKVENQVLGWIQKFDQDIGEKQAEEEEIQALLDSEMKDVDDIQSKLDEQEEEYDELMQEKAEYEEEMLERRLYQFIMNRSARRIQRGFRLYKARKLAKKMAKKSKKGGKKK